MTETHSEEIKIHRSPLVQFTVIHGVRVVTLDTTQIETFFEEEFWPLLDTLGVLTLDLGIVNTQESGIT